ncbi:MAG: rRNA maturation RNase YbeY [Chloroflexi bacterium]|nr:rRNA maturation RNase YbeY [Chloroflexota bacterium]
MPDRHIRLAARRALLAARRRGRFALSVAFVSDDAIRRLNARYAGDDYVTDVLSFPSLEGISFFAPAPTADTQLGDIIVALPQAARQARAAGHALIREVELLVTHGVLHLIGYDHGTAAQKQAMDTVQARAMRK